MRALKQRTPHMSAHSRSVHRTQAESGLVKNAPVTKSGCWSTPSHDITEPMETYVSKTVRPPRG